MAENQRGVLENRAKEIERAQANESRETNRISDIVLKCEGEESISSCQEHSPKSRRKISKPKHYIPTSNDEDSNEHSGITQTTEDLAERTSSPESVVQEGESLPVSSAVHVLTANQGSKNTESSPSRRAANSQKPKRATASKPAPKKGKYDAPTIPRKPEDLIKEAMMLGQQTPPAGKRDAQYRKSYAYKIWREKGSQELTSNTEEANGNNTARHKLPGPLQNQARAAFYWPGNQYNGTTPPGFFANGKFYAINPQVIPALHGRPDVPPTSPNGPTLTVGTTAHSVPSSVFQGSTAGVVSSSGQMVQYSAIPPISCVTNPRDKVGPPNVTVVPQYPKEANRPPIPVKSPVVKSPEIKTPPLPQPPNSAKVVSPVPVPQDDVVKRGSPRANGSAAKTSEGCDTKAVSTETSPSNLVSIMKTSLRQKHSKENVQPLPNMFKTKRKLDNSGKGEGPASKKNGKPTIFTPLNEHDAEKLANDIYDVNLEYFPFQTLAEKAAQSEETLPETPDRSEKTDKVKEIEKVRCLLKDFYDVTFSCTEDPDMQKFDSASRKFGRKNILNHLSLLDRYFAELQKKFEA